jgi:methionyl-tRNA formyltransferase
MKIIFAGTPDFAVPALEVLIHSPHEIIAVYTQPDRPSGRGQKLTPSPVKSLALQHNLSIYQPTSLKDREAQQILINQKPDLIVVVAYGLILPKIILDAPKYGCINIHGSLLPRWRGAAPLHRAILAGDKETGITIMQMEAGLDTGPMLYKSLCPITTQDNLKTLHDKLSKIGAECLIKVLDNIENIQPDVQDNSLSTYASKISKEEANLDWTKSAEELDRAVRAYYPAYSYLNSQMIKVWEVSIKKNSPPASQAAASIKGAIVELYQDKIDVMTGNGILSLLKLQLPGGKILSTKEILNSKANLFAVGNIFTFKP